MTHYRGSRQQNDRSHTVTHALLYPADASSAARQVWRTRAIDNTVRPVWRERATVELDIEGGEEELVLEVYDKDLLSGDDLMAVFRLRAEEIDLAAAGEKPLAFTLEVATGTRVIPCAPVWAMRDSPYRTIWRACK